MKKLLLFCTMLVVAQTGHGFGVSGSGGSDGRDGQNGKNGEDIAVMALPGTYYLNGTSASIGRDGSDGSDAFACSYSEGHSNEYGADGGAGGDGGDGGNGGRGGDATIFYSDLAELKSITIENQGGYGAPGGRGANPGYGCQCYSSSWSVQSCSTTESCTTTRVCEDTGETRTQGGRTAPARVCHDRRVCSPVTSCSTETYSCYDGSAGRSGRNGSHGGDGRWGLISLVKDIEELPGQFPSGTFDVTELAREEILLSKRLWKKKTGAKSLFHQSSLIQDSYREYVRLAQRDFRLVWKAQAPVENFIGNKFALSYDGEKLTFKDSGDDFLKYEVQELEDATVVTVTEAFKKDELINLEVAGTNGYGDKLVITVKDKAKLSHLVENKVKLQFVYKKWFTWWVVYDEVVPASALEITEDGIVIHVGKLGLEYSYIKKRRKVRFTVSIDRSFGNNTANIEEFFGPVKLY